MTWRTGKKAVQNSAKAIALGLSLSGALVDTSTATAAQGEVVLPVSTLWGQGRLLYVATDQPPCEQVPADEAGEGLSPAKVGCPAVAVGQLINYWLENGQADGWLDTMLQGVKVYPRPWSFGGIGQAACTHPGFTTQDGYGTAGWDQVKRLLWQVGIGLDTDYDQSISGLTVYPTEKLGTLICPPQLCGTVEKPSKMASLLVDRFRFKVIRGPSNRLTRLDDASDVIVAALDARRPVLLMLGQGPLTSGHMALIQGYRPSLSGGLSRYDFQVNFGWGPEYPLRWVPGGGAFATDPYTWKEFWVIDLAPATAAEPGLPQSFARVGSYSNYRLTADHRYGVAVDLWRDGTTLVGLFSHAVGPQGDMPTGRLEDISFDPSTGRISFTARFTMGEHYCDDHYAVPSQDVVRFSGRLSDSGLSGTLELSDNLHPERASIEETVTLPRSSYEPAISYSTRQELERDIEAILKGRGPRW